MKPIMYYKIVFRLTCITCQTKTNLYKFSIFQNKKKLKLLVAAIDFGTTYSGYACLTKDEFETYKGDNSKIHCPTWEREGGLSYQAPTSVLFRPNKTFHSFGYDAEKYYHENSDNIDFKEWYFYKHFKMKLYTDKVIL